MLNPIRVLLLGRLSFCSEDCFDAALETDLRPTTGRVHPEVAATMQCYGCGEYLAPLPVGSVAE
jgi:hypothetical protein